MENAGYTDPSLPCSSTMAVHTRPVLDGSDRTGSKSKNKFGHRLTTLYRSFKKRIGIESRSTDPSSAHHHTSAWIPRNQNPTGFTRSQSMYFQGNASVTQRPVGNVSNLRLHQVPQSLSLQNLSRHQTGVNLCSHTEPVEGTWLNPTENREWQVAIATATSPNPVSKVSHSSAMSHSTSFINRLHHGSELRAESYERESSPEACAHVRGPFRSQWGLCSNQERKNHEKECGFSRGMYQSSSMDVLSYQPPVQHSLQSVDQGQAASNKTGIAPKIKHGVSSHLLSQAGSSMVSKIPAEKSYLKIHDPNGEYCFQAGMVSKDEAQTRYNPLSTSTLSGDPSVELNQRAAENLISLYRLVKTEGYKKYIKMGDNPIQLEHLKVAVMAELEQQGRVLIHKLFQPFADGQCARKQSIPILLITIEGQARIEDLESPQELAIIPLEGALGVFSPKDLETKCCRGAQALELKTFIDGNELFSSHMIDQLNRRYVFSEGVFSMTSFVPDAMNMQLPESHRTLSKRSPKGESWV